MRKNKIHVGGNRITVRRYTMYLGVMRRTGIKLYLSAQEYGKNLS